MARSPGFPGIEHHQELHSAIKATVGKEQPFLKVSVMPNGIVVEGEYLLLATDNNARAGGPFARHLISILTPWDYPKREPVVKMLDRSLPWTENHHIDKNGVCCITTYATWRITAADKSWRSYFDGPIYNFFLSQYLYRRTGKWPFGDYAHGTYGMVQAISEVLGCEANGRKVRGFLTWRRGSVEVDIPAEHRACPCKSGRTTGRCCADRLAEIGSRISQKVASDLLAALDGRPDDLSDPSFRYYLRRHRPETLSRRTHRQRR